MKICVTYIFFFTDFTIAVVLTDHSNGKIGENLSSVHLLPISIFSSQFLPSFYLDIGNCSQVSNSYHYFIPSLFFPLADAAELSLESEWQQVSSVLEPSSRYSGRYQQCCCLDDLDSSYVFQFLFSFQAFRDCSKSTDYCWYHRHPYDRHLFSYLAKSKYFSIISLSFISTLWTAETAKSTRRHVFFLN